jgi:hypothetical protein
VSSCVGDASMSWVQLSTASGKQRRESVRLTPPSVGAWWNKGGPTHNTISHEKSMFSFRILKVYERQ